MPIRTFADSGPALLVQESVRMRLPWLPGSAIAARGTDCRRLRGRAICWNPPMIRIAMLPTPEEASALLAHLRAHGIAARGVDADHVDDWPINAPLPIEIEREADRAEAERLIDAFWQRRRPTILQPDGEPVKCVACGYDLRGHDGEGDCPECGHPFTTIGLDESPCPRCSALVPEHFAFCWRCGKSMRSDRPDIDMARADSPHTTPTDEPPPDPGLLKTVGRFVLVGLVVVAAMFIIQTIMRAIDRSDPHVIWRTLSELAIWAALLLLLLAPLSATARAKFAESSRANREQAEADDEPAAGSEPHWLMWLALLLLAIAALFGLRM